MENKRELYTEQEKKVMDLLVQAHNEFTKLEELHPSHPTEWTFHLHGMQRIVAQRILTRNMPEDFYNQKEKKS